jgi:hypothetical protein
VNVTWSTLLKLSPLAESVASYGAVLVVIAEGLKLLRARVGMQFDATTETVLELVDP